MTAGSRVDEVADHAGLPSLTLDARQLGDLELILSGAFAPLRGFMTQADVTAVTQRGVLPDGTPWPIPVTLDVRADAVRGVVGRVLLADPEGTPLAVLTITERAIFKGGGFRAIGGSGVPPGQQSVPPEQHSDDWVGLAGPVTRHRAPEHGSFRRLMVSPQQARAESDGRAVLAYATRAPLGWRQIGQLRHYADRLGARALVLPMVVGDTRVVGDTGDVCEPRALVRAVLAAARSLPSGTMVIPIPLAPRPERAGVSPARELAAIATVAAAYGATHLLTPGTPGAGQESPGVAIRLIDAGDWAYDPRAGVWRPHSLIEPGAEIEDLSADQLADLLDSGGPIPPWFAPEAVIAQLRHARPPRSERGLVLFLTGLSGSGKSTIARDLRDLLAERSDRRVSLLDGDLVRSLLSVGLTFSRADRDLNVARIGYVAAEIAKHGGIAICAPIAPFAEARERVRQMVSQAGDFLLIHVATPLEVCEARDRKGLYAKARAGLTEHFTGVCDPYEEPTDAIMTIDTSVVSRHEAASEIMAMLTSGGWLAGGPAALCGD